MDSHAKSSSGEAIRRAMKSTKPKKIQVETCDDAAASRQLRQEYEDLIKFYGRSREWRAERGTVRLPSGRSTYGIFLQRLATAPPGWKPENAAAELSGPAVPGRPRALRAAPT